MFCSPSLPPPRKSLVRVVYSLQKTLRERALLSWRRGGQLFIKMSNDLWSPTPDRITFLLAVSRPSLCVGADENYFYKTVGVKVVKEK